MSNASTQASSHFRTLVRQARRRWDVIRSQEQIEADEWLQRHLITPFLDVDLFLLDLD
jgi:hypothetical protein